MNIFQGEYKGKKVYRRTNGSVTHVIAYVGVDGVLYGVVWCARHDLAIKQLHQHQAVRQKSIFLGGAENKIVKLVEGPVMLPVTLVEDH
ncbi:hypothetical protein ACFSR7_06080 [Cohnella sp. GCM10020058]|uniref:hypothetical protein n=1 Tax=Cohnella sp. GCM10020058 TaxID=3317330 RepID=UPI003641D79C